MAINGDALIWIDLEMDGLDLTKNYILEIACIITDFNVTKTINGPDLVINHPKSLLDAMGSWCMEHHTRSGLVQQILNSKISMSDAETQIINFIMENTVADKSSRLILAGNSVYVDRYFLEKDMPTLNSMLDKSILDCSTLKELICRFNYRIYQNAPIKGGNLHRALDDVQNSITEFQYYQNHAFEQKQYHEQTQPPIKKDVRQYMVWININEKIVHCILTDSNLNVIDEITNGKTDDDLMKFFKRNNIRYEKTVVVAGEYLGPMRAELKKLAPEFNEFCHYRSIDIDVVSIICEKWFPEIYKQRPRNENETDLKNSIDLLRFYRSAIFK